MVVTRVSRQVGERGEEKSWPISACYSYMGAKSLDALSHSRVIIHQGFISKIQKPVTSNLSIVHNHNILKCIILHAY